MPPSADHLPPQPLSAQELVALEMDLLQLAYDRQPLGMLLLVMTGGIGHVLWLTLFPGTEMLLWESLVFLVAVVGFVDTWAFRRITLTPQNLRHWQLRAFVRSIFTGGAWGVGATLVSSKANGWGLAAVSVMNICMYSGAIAILMPQWKCLFVYLLAASIASIWLLFAHQEPQAILFGALVLLATCMEIMIGWLLNRNLRSLLETQLRLRAAKNEAEAANRHKSQFLSNMSHEIRTPMHAVLGMIQLMRSTELSAQQRDYARKTELAANALLSLINDILDFSKIEAGSVQLDAQPFALNTLMLELETLMLGNVGTKPIQVKLSLDPSVPPYLVGDVTRLRQVLTNIGGNAVKFTERGEVTLSTSLIARSKQQVQIRFAVRDTGIGIAPQQQSEVFGEFAQADAQTTRKFGGTGLGLSISKRLVALMGGHLHLESTPGKGSYFYFQLVLPVASAAAFTATLAENSHPA